MLDREEYIEQAYFFRVYRERLEANVPAQEILSAIHEEILATTRLPMAIEFLRGEIMLTGRISDGMKRLGHYFAPFQTYVMSKAEEERSKFDQKIALDILAKEAEYRAANPTAAGLFVYQFECLARNRLGYDYGMLAMSDDPFYNAEWREWIRRIRMKLGTTEFTDLIYYRSEQYVLDRRRRGEPEWQASYPIFFGSQEGRIAKANKGRDPLYMFAALQRQLGYPAVPRATPRPTGPILHPAVEQRLLRMEERIKLLEMENKGGIDLSKFAPPSDDRPAK
ncbi:MAG: hypothetical protein IT428_24465 [Planctomycetaceae bacterium]|nr:hypothetical protein [Planctomycetaceae bacterium]